VPIHSANIQNEFDFYQTIRRISWEEHMDLETRFSIQVTQSGDLFRNTMFAAQKAKDALVDRFRKQTGKRPSVGRDDPDLSIHIHIGRGSVEVSLDASGASLHHRGYRTATNIAPINEVLAAGLLMLSGWKGECDFLDPMCGSGTLLIEAAMIACNIPPQLNRKQFAFERWSNWDAGLFELIRASALKKTRDFHWKIMGYDKAPSAVRKANDNVDQAGLSDFIHIEKQDFFRSAKPNPESALHMVFNPPYGERLPIDMKVFYGRIGDTLKQLYPNTHAWLISSNLEALKYVGLKPSAKIKLFNGKLESRLVHYTMYKGSLKNKSDA
jgi:putative N6-adenine-specific DNA methylase